MHDLNGTGRAIAWVISVVIAGAVFLAMCGSARAQPLQTGIFDPNLFSSSQAPLAFQRTQAAGATVVRLLLHWRTVAPAGNERPAGFTAEDPGAPQYSWDSFDRQVRLASERGLELIATVEGSPDWAEGEGDGAPGTRRPDPAEFAKFARAAAERYSGRFGGLPRIRYWQAWNEPNLIHFLSPQFIGKSPFAPPWYRTMLNQFADAVHSVRSDNLVVAGGLAPFTDNTGKSVKDYGPLAFMRDMLCLSKQLRPTCEDRSTFDVWAHNPYTSGGPTHHAARPDDVSIGDLPEMRRVLRAAFRAGRITSKGEPGFWVTEFSWDSKPPDPGGVPTRLHARWVAEALYRMWSSGVTLVTWFRLRDDPYPGGPFQSGLYRYSGDTIDRDAPKLALAAFRFPFVAFRQGGQIRVWGRAPSGRTAQIVVEQRMGASWIRLALLRADSNGVFSGNLRAASTRGLVRARLNEGGATAVPFSLTRPPDRPVRPFGAS